MILAVSGSIAAGVVLAAGHPRRPECGRSPAPSRPRASLQRFLDLAGMTHTTLGPGILWGLTQATAPDELRLLMVLTSANRFKGLLSGL